MIKPKAYCSKCKKKRTVRNSRPMVVKLNTGNTRNAVRGTCGNCCSNIFQFVKSGNMVSRLRTWISASVGRVG